MPGKLGSASLSAETNTLVYTVPAEKSATVAINVCNCAATNAGVRIAITTQAGSPLAADYIEYDVVIPVAGVLERTGICLSAGEKIVVRSTVASVSVRVHGFEE